MERKNEVILYYEKVLDNHLTPTTKSAFFDEGTGSLLSLMRDNKVKEMDINTLQMMIESSLYEHKSVIDLNGKVVSWQTSSQLADEDVNEEEKSKISKFENAMNTLNNIVERHTAEQVLEKMRASVNKLADGLLTETDPSVQLFLFMKEMSLDEKNKVKMMIAKGKQEGKDARIIIAEFVSERMSHFINSATIKFKHIAQLDREPEFKNLQEVESFMHM